MTKLQKDKDNQSHSLLERALQRDYTEFPWLVFELNGQSYAIKCRYVTSIIERPDDVVPAIESPGYMSGLMNIRGEIIPLINSRKFFGMATPNLNTKDTTQPLDEMVIVLSNEERSVGYSIDAVTAVEEIRVVSTASNTKSIEKSKYLYGVGIKANDPQESIVLLLDDVPLLGVMATDILQDETQKVVTSK